MKHILVICILILNISVVHASAMTQDVMEDIISSKVEVVNKKKGFIVFMYQKVKMMLISDVKHNRMRIIAPVAQYPKLTVEQITIIMESNFHRALDARYAVRDNVLYSAFIHPLSPLSKHELVDALNQVSRLARSFGSTYSSSELSFGGK